MLQATLIIESEQVTASSVTNDEVILSVTQGASLWESEDATHVKPIGGKKVNASWLELSGKQDAQVGKGLSSNDYTNEDKTAVALIPNKVDKVEGKGLSKNDYVDADAAKVAMLTSSGSGTKALSDNGSYLLFAPLTGFSNQSSVVVNYDSTTRKVTLTGSFEATYNGAVVPALTSGWVSGAHAAVTGIYYLRYNGSFVFDTTPPSYDDVLIAQIYYGATSRFGLRETHGTMRGIDHEEQHQTVGTYKVSGGDFSGYTPDNTTAAERRPLISETIIKDEDLKTTLPALATETYCRRYLSGTNTRNFEVDQSDIVSVTGAIPNYNQWNGSAWVQTPMTNNQYAAVFVAAMPVTSDAASQKYRFVFVQPQTVSTDLATIQALAPSSLNLGDSTSLVSEYCFIGKVIIKYQGSNWTITSISKLEGTKIAQISIPSSPTPTASSVSYTPTGNIAATDVQSAITELDSEKQATLVSGTSIKTINGSSLLGSGDMVITGSVSDGDKGDITVSGSGSTWSIDNGVVTEAKQILADNTTGNVSTAAHGYVPKAPNDVTKVLRGDGTWAVIPTATQSTDGLLSSADKIAHDALAALSNTADVLATDGGLDCNTVTKHWHLGGNSGTNYPINASGTWFYVETVFYTTTRCRQIAYGYTDNRVYTRQLYGGTWSSWIPIMTANEIGLKNQSVSSQTGFASDTYLTGSFITFPYAPKVGTTYKLTFDVTKTAAGTATPIITIRTGTAGSTSDTSRCVLTFGAGTAVVDSGLFEVVCTFRTVGSSTSAVLQSISTLTSNLTTTGISNGVKAKQVTSSGFDSTTANLGIGASYNGGASAAHTIQLVNAQLIM